MVEEKIYLQCLLLNTNPSAKSVRDYLIGLMNLIKIYTNIIRKLEKFWKKVTWQEWKNWDKLHPELNHFTEKYLREATYIEKRGYLLQTANVTNSNTENSNVETDIQIEDTSGE